MCRLIATTLVCFGLAVPAVSAQIDCSDVEEFSGAELGLEIVASVAQPVDVTAIAGDTSRLFIVEQTGRVRIVELPADNLVTEPFLDIRSKVMSGGERGLLGLAFHPNYEANGQLFVNYTSRPGGATVVSRFTVSDDDPNVVSPNSEEVLLTFSQPFGNHNGGQVQFGPNDGYLYIATGDGGSGGDPGNRAQDGNSLLGKLLRIDVDTATDDLAYGIPPSNPFVNDDNMRDEIWALGLRNPWRFDFDGETGDLYIGDVGQNAWEEIDFQPGASTGGENYEWRVREGDHGFRNQSYGVGTRVGPIYDYSHGTGNSVTGGVVYRGCRMPDLRGIYFFADYARSWIRSFRVVDGAVTEMTLQSELRPGQVSAFGEDASGEIYICGYSGRVHRVIPGALVNHRPTARVATDPDPAVVRLAGGTAEILLDGSPSDDGDDGTQTLIFEWSKSRGPDGDTIVSPSEASTVVTFTAPGSYRYTLRVVDDKLTDTERVNVTVDEPLVTFKRGDANGDREFNVSDPVFSLDRLFGAGGASAIPCWDSLDANDDGVFNISDPVFALNYLFGSGAEPGPPFSECGADPTDDALGCGQSSCP